jgi:hypothetical protein
MPGNPLNYSTIVSPDKSANECTAMLGRFGAVRTGLAYDRNRVPFGLTFVLNTRWGERLYELPVDFEGTYQVLLKAYKDGKIKRSYAERGHAQRVAWRVVKDWLEANLALIEQGLMEADRVMFPYMLVAPELSVFSAYDEQQPAIGSGQ